MSELSVLPVAVPPADRLVVPASHRAAARKAKFPHTLLATQRIERGVWLIGGAAGSFAGYLLWRFEIPVAREGLAPFLCLLLLMIAIRVVFSRWQSTQILSNLAAAFAMAVWSIVTAAAISLVGLRYKYPLIDGFLAGNDRFLGVNHESLVQWFSDHPGFTPILTAAYCSSFQQVAALLVVLGATRRLEKLWQLVFVLSLTIVASATLSVFWPAAGAFIYFDHPAGVVRGLPGGAGVYHFTVFQYFRDGLSPELSLGNLQGVVTFPSFHCCLALMSIWATVGTSRLLLVAAVCWNLIVLIATIPIGGHYLIDLPCGALLWLAAMSAEQMLRRSPI